MTPDRWLFFPGLSVGVSAPVQFTGNINKDLSGSNRAGVNNWAVTGSDAIEYDEYPFSGFRKLSTSIEWIVRIDTTQTYADLNAWNAANTLSLSGSSISLDGTLLNATSLTVAGSGTGNLARFRFGASSSDLTTWWNAGLNGDPLSMTINYT